MNVQTGLLDCDDSLLLVVDARQGLTVVMPEHDPALMPRTSVNLLNILIGQAAHVCIPQAAIDLIHRVYRVQVVEDGLCSRRPGKKSWALRSMRRHDVKTVCHDSVLFEWPGDARHPDFKTMSAWLR